MPDGQNPEPLGADLIYDRDDQGRQSAARSALINSVIEAPSLSCEEFPAVTEPSSANVLPGSEHGIAGGHGKPHPREFRTFNGVGFPASGESVAWSRACRK